MLDRVKQLARERSEHDASGPIIVGMSGGVDSSVAAYLLKESGYEVRGLFMKNWEEDDGTEYCTAKEDLADAQAVCDRLGIELLTANFAAEYWDNVFEHFLAEYQAGRTPNPDVLCNREIKFKAFLDYATELGAARIATGHYVRRTEARPASDGESCEDSGAYLLKGKDNNKDQSYFLCEVSANCLARSLFPVGELEKSEVRAIARDLGLATHAKKDSTGICFIGERKFKDFLEQYLPAQPGEIRSSDGQVVGSHSGLMYYTLGQRQGLGIGGIRNRAEAPWYVVGKDLKQNILIVSQGNESEDLYSRSLLCAEPFWINGSRPDPGVSLKAKIRYRQEDQACQLVTAPTGRGLQVDFDEPQRSVTPGQYVVFYDGERCLGGAIIENYLR
jgi:tRNA-specific 2-thiouridylase